MRMKSSDNSGANMLFLWKVDNSPSKHTLDLLTVLFRYLLRRAFDNLYSNLMKYADPSVPIEIDFHREGEQVHLILKNGIPSQMDKKESTNIGLNTCKRILKYHNGSFETEVTEKSFCARVCLPIQ